MPPPNVTSQAHIGHALDMTYQDILIRFKRMQGYSALWLPGADHAALATEHKLVEKLANEGKTKEAIGREEFDKEAWAWYNFYGNRIMTQFKTLGFSADWDRYRFTMDDHSTKAVLEAKGITEIHVITYTTQDLITQQMVKHWQKLSKVIGAK